MWRSLIRISLVLVVLLAPASRAAPTRFTGTLRLLTSVGTTPDPFLLLSVPVAGTAEISGTLVRIPAGAIRTAIPSIADFGGTLVNRAATFSMSGAGTGSTCPLLALQEVCIDGGGFGRSMQLSGVTHLGRELLVWGSDGTNSGMTASGLPRTEQARLWTQGRAQAAFYIPEIDATPFSISGTGSFLGLPGSTLGDAGFSLVAPMVITSQETNSLRNVRAIASLRIVFTPPAVPASAAGILAVVLTLIGVFRLHRLQRLQRLQRHNAHNAKIVRISDSPRVVRVRGRSDRTQRPAWHDTARQRRPTPARHRRSTHPPSRRLDCRPLRSRRTVARPA